MTQQNRRSGSSRVTRLVAVAAVLALSACAQSPTNPSEIPVVPRPGAQSPGTGVAVGTGVGAGLGNTPARLSDAGWTCMDVPGHGVHCWPGPKEFGISVNIPVRVFDTSDPESDSATFLGTENLVREDRYHGQPCLPGHGTYFLLPFGYYACHHFQ